MLLNEWAEAALAHQFGNYVDVDGYYQGQCWDLAAHYAREVVGCPNLPTITGGASGVFLKFASPIPDYFTKVANNPNDPNQLPPAGALIVYGATAGNQYGHIEIVMGANASGVDVILQDGFNPTRGPFREFRRWGQLPCLGWLIPKKNVTARDLQAFQRVVAKDGVYRRKSPTINETSIELIDGGEILDFAGWLYGQVIDNNNVWYKGKYSDTYFWSGAFTDSSKNGLTDLNPVAPAPTAPNQRIVTDGGLNVRSEPSTMAQVIKTLPQGTTITLQGFDTGATVDGNNIWFKIADGWVWSGGVTDPRTDGVSDVTPDAPVIEPAPVYPQPTNDASITKVFNKKHALAENYEPTDLVTLSNGQRLRSEAAASLELMRKVTSSLNPVSGYRSFAQQKALYDNYVATDGKEEAERYSARPGYSEHQTGLTMDFAPIEDAFRNGTAYKFLTENGHKYGWILRYPDGKEATTGYMPEPWHWRYVGVDVATDMHNKGVSTLEEYYEIEGGGYADDTPTDPVDTDEPVVVAPTPDPATPDVVTEIKTVVVNAVVTFVQAFIATWAATGFQLDKVVIAGGVGAAASLVWNTILKPFAIKKGWLKQ